MQVSLLALETKRILQEFKYNRFFHLICLFLSKTYYMQVDSHKESISLYLINKSERWYNYSGITKTTRVDLELD